MNRKRIKITALAVIIIFLGFVFADSIGVFNTENYRVVPHGSHNHYVPKDRDMNAPLDAFPTEEPAEGERITPFGDVVRD
ncbi:MAG: hypothetical protein WD267_13110 [Balneolales bacterium]